MRSCLALLAITTLVVGCASVQPRTGENGESLVFVKTITGAWIPSGPGNLAGQAVAGPIAGGYNPIAAGAAGASVGLLLHMIKGPEVIVTIYDHDTREPGAPAFVVGHARTLQRSPWPGIERLSVGTWAILAQDEHGDDIVLPCPTPCAPAK